MIETYATATDFRKHLAQIANAVGYRQDRCVVLRHGKEMVALISYEDLQFLRKYRPRKIGPPSVDAFSPKAGWHDHFPDPPLPQTEPPPGEEMVTLIDPFEMPLEEVRTYYEEFRHRNDDAELLDWIGRAAVCLAVNRIPIKNSA
jgi:hypothetical protein